MWIPRIPQISFRTSYKMVDLKMITLAGHTSDMLLQPSYQMSPFYNSFLRLHRMAVFAFDRRFIAILMRELAVHRVFQPH